MSEKNTSQVQQAQDAWKSFVTEQVGRMNSVFEELGKLQAQAAENAGTAIDEVARLGKQSITWSSDLFASWRRIALDAAKRATDLAAR